MKINDSKNRKTTQKHFAEIKKKGAELLGKIFGNTPPKLEDYLQEIFYTHTNILEFLEQICNFLRQLDEPDRLIL